MLATYAPTGGFGNWIALGGLFGGDPSAAACSDGSIYVVGRDQWRSLWGLRYIPGAASAVWHGGGGIIQGNPSVVCGTDNVGYVVVKDDWNALWMARIQGDTWVGWSFGGAVMSGDPQVAGAGGTIYTMLRDTWGNVWMRGYTEGPSGGWQPWTFVGGPLQDISAISSTGGVYFVGRDPKNEIWWYRSVGNKWSWVGQKSVAAGPLAGSPR